MLINITALTLHAETAVPGGDQYATSIESATLQLMRQPSVSFALTPSDQHTVIDMPDSADSGGAAGKAKSSRGSGSKTGSVGRPMGAVAKPGTGIDAMSKV